MAETSGFQIDKRFKKKVRARYERYTLEAGVLKNKPHKEPRTAQSVLKARAKSKPVPSAKPKGKAKPKTAKKKAKSFTDRVKARGKKAGKASKNRKAMVKRNRARGLGTLMGGPVRLKKVTTKGTVMQVGEYMRKVHKIPYLTAPFARKTNEVKAMLAGFMALNSRQTTASKVETLARAVIRIPFLKKRYGRNSAATQKVKTFNRLGIDTGQFFTALDAKVRVNPNVPK